MLLQRLMQAQQILIEQQAELQGLIEQQRIQSDILTSLNSELMTREQVINSLNSDIQNLKKESSVSASIIKRLQNQQQLSAAERAELLTSIESAQTSLETASKSLQAERQSSIIKGAIAGASVVGIVWLFISLLAPA